MNGLWFIVFGFTALMIISGVGAIIVYIKSQKYLGIYKRERRRRKSLDEPTEKEVTAEQKHDIMENFFCGFMVPLIISAICWLIFFLCAIFCPVSARKEVSYFKHQKSYVESAVTNGSDLENIAITQVIINQNNWLAQAKSRLDTFGRFSKYYNVGLEDVTPIIIER